MGRFGQTLEEVWRAALSASREKNLAARALSGGPKVMSPYDGVFINEVSCPIL